ncbi:MAG: hypothetical protein AAF372_04645 [Pseudomonadota bacterium]
MKIIILKSLLALTFLVFTTSSHALIVNTSVGVFDVTAVEGSFSEFESLLTVQPWWDNSSLAIEFAVESATAGIGYPNNTERGIEGPWFAFEIQDTVITNVGVCKLESMDCVSTIQANTINRSGIYAIATPIPLPAAAWLFITGVFGLAFNLRKTNKC